MRFQRNGFTTGQITVRAVNASAAANQAFELWMLPTAGQAPKSMGLMPVAGGKAQFQMSETLLAVLRKHRV